MTRKLKIGIDIDEVIVDYFSRFYEFVYLKTGRKFTKEETFSGDIWKVMGTSREEDYKMHCDFYHSNLFDKMEPIKGAPEAIKSIMQRHEIYVITARETAMHEKTRMWFDRHIPQVSHIAYVGNFTHNGIKRKEKVEV